MHFLRRRRKAASPVAELRIATGLEIIDQRVIDWREAHALDCLSLFRKPDSI